MSSKHYGSHRARWSDENGVRRSATFPEAAMARYFEQKKKSEALEIRRGIRCPAPVARPFGDIADYWIANRASQKRSGKDDESIIRRHLRVAFGASEIGDIGTAAVDRFVLERGHLSRKTLNNIVTLLISMLRVAVDLGWLAKLPRIRKPAARYRLADFQFLRTDADIRRFLDAARVEGEHVFAMYAAAVWTGARAGELAALQWSDVDLERRLVTIHRSFDGPTKSDDVRYVPIVDPLLDVLRPWRLRCPSTLVLPNANGGMHGKSARIFQEVLKRVLARAGFGLAQRGGKQRPYIRFHDLRHTMASHWAMKGGDLFKLQRILGHKSIAMTMRYAHLAPDAFAADYARFAAQAVPAGDVRPFPAIGTAKAAG